MDTGINVLCYGYCDIFSELWWTTQRFSKTREHYADGKLVLGRFFQTGSSWYLRGGMYLYSLKQKIQWSIIGVVIICWSGGQWVGFLFGVNFFHIVSSIRSITHGVTFLSSVWHTYIMQYNFEMKSNNFETVCGWRFISRFCPVLYCLSRNLVGMTWRLNKIPCWYNYWFKPNTADVCVL